MTTGIAYCILDVLYSRTKGIFGISIFIKQILFLKISLKVSEILTTQIDVKLVKKPVFIQFYLIKKAKNFIDNHPKL